MKLASLVMEANFIFLFQILGLILSLIHISEPTRQYATSRMPSSA